MKRSSDKQKHLSALFVPQGTEISLTGKCVVSVCNLVVCVADRDLLIMEMKLNIHKSLDNKKKYQSSL